MFVFHHIGMSVIHIGIARILHFAPFDLCRTLLVVFFVSGII